MQIEIEFFDEPLVAGRKKPFFDFRNFRTENVEAFIYVSDTGRKYVL